MHYVNIGKMLKQTFGADFVTQEEIDSKQGIANVIALEQSHKAAKDHLGGRVQVLRVLIMKKHLAKRMTMSEFEFLTRVEKQLDNLLAKHKYFIEDLILRLREGLPVIA